MKTYDEVHEALEKFDGMVGGIDGYMEAIMVGGGALMYHMERAGISPEDRSSTDDVDLVTGDIDTVMELHDRHGHGALGTSATPILVSGDEYIDITWHHPCADAFQDDIGSEKGYEVDGLENTEIHVISPQTFIEDKGRFDREKDRKDIERMERVISHFEAPEAI